MTKSKASAPRPRTVRTKGTSGNAESRVDQSDRAVDEVVDEAVDAMIEQLTEAAPHLSEATSSEHPMSEPAAQPKVRGKYTMSGDEYRTLEALKARLEQLSHPARKSTVLRAGVAVLAGLSDRRLLAAIAIVPSLKAGRTKGMDGKHTSGKKGSAAG